MTITATVPTAPDPTAAPETVTAECAECADCGQTGAPVARSLFRDWDTMTERVGLICTDSEACHENKHAA